MALLAAWGLLLGRHAGQVLGWRLVEAGVPTTPEGERLLVQYMGERYPVTVAVAGSRPLFDPENSRVRS